MRTYKFKLYPTKNEQEKLYNASINIYRRGKELTFVGEDALASSMNQESMSLRA